MVMTLGFYRGGGVRHRLVKEGSILRRRLFHFIAAVSMAAASMVSTVQAAVVSFGSGGNQFNMEFVTIGNPGNTPDTTGAPNLVGAVGYT